ncbi:MAG: flagellar basal-body rod protein FlgF [Terriglobia bacterium]|nr:flagellar basal-body rod protein FlgF [Terriglobia bacterium]
MDSGFYAACAGLIAKMQALDLAANNLANSGTAGYRGQREVFRQLLAGTVPVGQLNRVVNAYGVMGDTTTDFSQGSLQKTDNPLDFAIEGRAMFAVKTSEGVRYTRAGDFDLGADRKLVTQDGDEVLGEQGAIRIPEGKLTVSDDGTLSINGAVAGRLKLIEFNPATRLTPVGDAYYSAPTAAAQPAKGSVLRQGMIEGSNVQPLTAAVNLIAIQRNSESLQRALYLFHNEFNRIAAQELPRIG